jgi:hypothetical protein
MLGKFLADILGVNVRPQWGPFRPVQTSNGVTLDFVDSKDVRTQRTPSWSTTRN